MEAGCVWELIRFSLLWGIDHTCFVCMGVLNAVLSMEFTFFYWVDVLKCSFSPFLFHEVHEFVMYLYVILPVILSCMHV